MKITFTLITIIGVLFSFVTCKMNGALNLFLIVSGPYFLLLITAEESLSPDVYKVKIILASIFLVLTISTHSFIFLSAPDRSGTGFSALPAAISLFLQYVASVIYLIVYYLEKRKNKIK